MDVIRYPGDLRRDPTNVITVGSFDGLHRGHRFLIAELLREATRRQGQATLASFEPHPRLVLGKPTPDEPFRILTTTSEKGSVLRNAGLHKFIVIPFSRDFAQISAETYVEQILWGQIGLQAIVVGEDHAFGKNRAGDIDMLRRFGRELGFDVVELGKYQVDASLVSSTRIRRLLQAGQVAEANALLGYVYGVDAKVVHGENRGKTLGFPTANLAPVAAEKLVPGHGVYAVSVTLGETEWLGMANIGVRPTFDGGGETVEVHIFDFSQDIYGRDVRLCFHSKLRDERRFAGVAELIQQLHRDKAQSLHYFAQMQNNHHQIHFDGEEHATHEGSKNRSDQEVR